jgi:hypothetical protein
VIQQKPIQQERIPVGSLTALPACSNHVETIKYYSRTYVIQEEGNKNEEEEMEVFPSVEDLRRWADHLEEVQERLAPYFERSEPRQRAMAYLRGL